LLVYAIVQTRGRQIKVTPGAVIEIDGPPGEHGSAFTFDQVLLIEKDAGDVVAGAPFVANAWWGWWTARREDRSCVCSRRSAAKGFAKHAAIAVC
jgi:ribosomal protein L21